MKRLVTLSVITLLVLVFGTVANAGQGPSEREPNNTKALADPISGYTISGKLDANDTTDWYKLNGQEGTRARFTISHSSSVDFDFQVYSGDTVVGTATGTGSSDSITCNIPGVCYVKVYRFRGSGSYTITIRPESGGGYDNGNDGGNSGDNGGNNAGGSDERESNDTKSLADSISGLSIDGSIGNSSDVDWFVLNGQEGVNPTFTITHDASNDFDFEVYSGDTSVGTALGISSGDSVTCNVPGKCYIKVWSSHGTGWYRITINP